MRFLKYAILFVSILLVINLAAYFLLDIKPTSSPENNAIRDVFVTTGSFVKDAISAVSDAVEQSHRSESEDETSEDDEEETAEADAAENQTQATQNNTQSQEEETEETDACLAQFNLTGDAIIFYHSNDIHSNAMIPIVDELSGNYSFYPATELWNYEFNLCFNLSGTIPAFVCAGTREKIEGEVSKNVLEEFCERC